MRCDIGTCYAPRLPFAVLLTSALGLALRFLGSRLL